MELTKGQVVMSRTGRDVNRYYVVVEWYGERVLLANGNKRTLAAPKAKNIRHIIPTKTVLLADEADTDAKVKAALAVFQNKQRGTTQGG